MFAESPGNQNVLALTHNFKCDLFPDYRNSLLQR